jgi:hypothetical protein
MSVKSADYVSSAADTNRGPSQALWAAPGGAGAWVEDYIQDPSLGMHFFDDFLVAGSGPAVSGAAFLGSMGQWSIYLGSSAGIADGGIVGGGLQFNPGSIAVSSGASTPTTAIGSQTGSFQITANSSGASALQGRLVFEARVMLTSITSGQRDAFIGLGDQGTPGATNPFTVVSGGSSQMLTTTRNLIGFYNADSGRGQDWAFMFQLASTAPVFCSNLNSLVSRVTGSAIAAGSFYKLGFVYNPQAMPVTIATASDGQTVGNVAKAMITVYVNGVAAAAFQTQTQNILTASFPTGIMGPLAAFCNVSNSGTSNSGTGVAGQMVLDWMRVAQTAVT